MARSALRAPSVAAARASERLWREVYVAAPVGDRAVEGYIDLLYQDGSGDLVVVDYKTDRVDSLPEIDAKVEQYRLQLAAYATALEASTGLSVAGARLVFCTPTEPFEREVPDLADAIAEVRRRLAGEPAA
jgi:ATP-dependent helicase/nuclease subunit A